MQRDNNRNRQPVSKHQQNIQMQPSQSRPSSSGIAILICLLASGIARTNAVPTDSVGGGIVCNGYSLGAARMVRDVAASLMQQEELPKEVVSTETTVLEQPQGQCLLDGVLVMETSVSCEKQLGCRAIQKTGHCCPDYKCDCEKDGKTYVNGDKLVDPETPCTVCYCQGGEILCSSVTCFHRDDCNPKYIPGRCCPIYDNCPVSVFDPNHNVEKTTPPATTAAPKKPPTQQLQLNPKITIKEITRPIEIRITDDNKAIPIHQMLKPSTTSSTTTEAPISTTPNVAALSTVDAYGELHSNNNNDESTTATAPAFSLDNNRQTLFPVGGINTENSLKLSASVAYPSTERAPTPTPQQQQQQQQQQPSTAAPNSSAETETSSELAAAKSTHVDARPTLPLFGTQGGLQRVDADSHSDPTKVNIKRENLATTERVRVSASAAAVEDFNSSELIYAQPSSVHDEHNIALQSSVIDLEPDTAGSDNIYHIILTTTGPRVDGSTDNYNALQSVSTTEGIHANVATDFHAEASKQQSVVLLPVAAPPAPATLPATAPQPQHTTDAPISSMQSAAAATPATPNSTSTNESSSTVGIDGSSTTETLKSSTDSAHHMEEEEAAIPVEANPAYPSLPEDDFSLRDVNFPLSETDDAVESEIKDEPRSIAHNFDIANGTKHIEEGSGNGADVGILLHSGELSSSTIDGGSSTTENTPNFHVKVALLMNSAEDLSAETAISNGSDFQLDRLATANKTDSDESLEAQLSSETGSGSGELNTETKKDKRREPTTPRPAQQLNLDIDELGNASGDGKSDTVEDPKLDAESIKADENIEEGIIKQEVGQREDVLTVNTNAAQERTLEEVIVPVIDSGINGRAERLSLHRFN